MERTCAARSVTPGRRRTSARCCWGSRGGCRCSTGFARRRASSVATSAGPRTLRACPTACFPDSGEPPWYVDLRHGLIGDLQAAVDDAEGFTQLLFRDDERRIGEEIVPADDREEPVLPEELAERAHFRRRTVERGHRLPGLPIANQLDDAEQAEIAHGADRRMALAEIGHQLAHHLSHAPGPLDEAVFF